MKQSTFSAVMANSIKNLLQGYTKSVRFLAVLTLLLTLGIGQAWAITFSGGYVYFDNTNTNWSGVFELVAHQYTNKDYIGCTTMSKISGTNNLYYVANPNGTNWGNIWGWRVMCNAAAWGSQDCSESNLKQYATHYTASSTQYNSLNYTQTVQQYLSTNGSTYAASTASIATVKVTANKLNGRNSTTSNSGTIASGSSSATCSAARTATVTYSVADVKAGYTFVGWYDGTTQKSTETTYDAYQATGAKTITARFNLNTYTVKWVVDGQEKATETVTHDSKPKKAPTLTPEQICGDKFVGWTPAPIEGQLKDATKITIYAPENIPAITEDITFYAVFADYKE